MKGTCIRCGKPFNSVDDVHTCTPPRALVLADALDFPDTDELEQAAAELRRLYWEELRVREHRDQMCMEVTRLHALNAELLEALRQIEKLPGISSANLYARRAIAKAESEKENPGVL